MPIYVLFKSNEILEKLTLYTSKKPTNKDLPTWKLRNYRTYRSHFVICVFLFYLNSLAISCQCPNALTVQRSLK